MQIAGTKPSSSNFTGPSSNSLASRHLLPRSSGPPPLEIWRKVEYGLAESYELEVIHSAVAPGPSALRMIEFAEQIL